MSPPPQKKATGAAAASMALLDRAASTIDKTAGLLEEATLVTDAATARSSSVRRELMAERSSNRDTRQPEGGGTRRADEVELLCRQDRLLQWLRWQQWIESTDRECRKRMAEDGDDSGKEENDKKVDKKVAVNNALPKCSQDLSEIETAVDNLARVNLMLEESGCEALRSYCRATFDALVRQMTAALEERIEENLSALNYPRCVLHEEEGVTLRDEGERAKFQNHFCLLIALARTVRTVGGADAAFEPSETLLRPLRKRFRFHFWGQKKTNNLVRPEWYLQQVRLWMRNAERFHETCFHGSKRESSLPHLWRLLQGMAQLASDKLRADVGEMAFDDVLLSHAVDEVLIFSKELHDLDYAKRIGKDKLPLSVLAEDGISARWLALERKFAFERIDNLLLDDDGWIPSPTNPDVLKCAETFVTLLQSITARYRLLEYPELQLKFVRLQCELIEDFRMRLVQILRQEQDRGPAQLSDKFGLILNSAHHLITVLESWSDLPLFLHLQYLSGGPSGGGNGDCCFAGVVDGFQFMIEDLSRTAASSILYEFRARSFEYRKGVRWTAYKTVYEDTPCTEMLGMVQALAAGLDNLSRRVRDAVLQLVLEHAAREVADFYLKDVVLDNFFDEPGIEQLAVDIRLGIMPVFRQFNFDPDRAAMSALAEMLVLLEARRPNALLLADAVRAATDAGDLNQIKEALAEFGITNLSGATANKILERRADFLKL